MHAVIYLHVAVEKVDAHEVPKVTWSRAARTYLQQANFSGFVMSVACGCLVHRSFRGPVLLFAYETPTPESIEKTNAVAATAANSSMHAAAATLSRILTMIAGARF